MVRKFYRMPDFLSSRIAVASLGLMLAFPVAAQQEAASEKAPLQSGQSLVERYPAGSILTIEAADQATIDLGQERLRVEAKFAEEERACYGKFFTTSCLDAAKEKKRLAMNEIRAVEVEANAFKRRDRVAKRDEELEKKRAENEARTQKEAKTPQSPASPTSKADQHDANAQQGPASRAVPVDDRLGRFQAQKAKREAKEAAEAQKRAENVKKYEKKQRESEERQRSIAAKQAEKAQKAKKESDKKTGETPVTQEKPEQASPLKP